MGCGCKSGKNISRPKTVVRATSPNVNGRRSSSGRIIKRIIK